MARAKFIKKQSREQLVAEGRLSTNGIRAKIARIMGGAVDADKLHTRLSRVMYQQRNTLYLFGLLKVSNKGRAYCLPVTASLWVAYLRWHGHGDKITPIEGSMFIEALLSGEKWTTRYTNGPRLQDLRDFIADRQAGNGRTLAKVVPLQRAA